MGLEPTVVGAPADPPIASEKQTSIDIDDLKSETSGNDAITDLFVSFPDVKGIEPEPNPLTIRACLIGIVLGSLVNASNVYLGRSISQSRISTFSNSLY